MGGTVEIEIPARSPYVGVVRLALASLARAAGIDEESVDDLKIATSEACSNAVLSGEESGSAEPIRVTWTEEPSRIVVEVIDRVGKKDEWGDLEDSGGFSTRLAMSGVLLESLVDGCEIVALDEGGILTRLLLDR